MTFEVDMKMVGVLDLSCGAVDVTDPCYDQDTRGRFTALPLRPGRYDCLVFRYTEGPDKMYVSAAAISCRSHDLDGGGQIRKIGQIGVDAGLAGFFRSKPDYTPEQWSSLVDAMKGRTFYIADDAFFTDSGFGDGCYDVWARYDRNDRIRALGILFL